MALVGEILRFLGKPLPETPSQSQAPARASRAVKTTGRALELRLTGLSLDISESTIKQSIISLSEPGDEGQNNNQPVVKSVARSVHPECGVATVHIPQAPGWIKRQPDGRISFQLEISGRQVSVDDHFDGLTPIHWPVSWDDFDFDIYAATGIAGHSICSWTAADALEMYLRDWLGQDLLKQGRRARVFTHSYQCNIIKSDNRATLNDYGKQLLAAVKGTRKTQKDQCRPLVFIGHSYGGLVIKQALKIAYADRSVENKNFCTSCVCFVQFGVPNAGLDNSVFLKMAENQSNRPLIEQLAKDERYLEELDDDFALVTRDYPINIVAIYETMDSRQAGIEDGVWKRNAGRTVHLVSRGSAVSRGLGQRVKEWPSMTNHSNLAKFETRHSPMCRDLLNEIATITNHAITKRERERSPSVINVPQGLCKHFVGRDGIMKLICDDLGIESKNGRDGHVVVLHGGGGMGKSQIARQHIHSHTDAYSKIIWVNAESRSALDESFRAAASLMGFGQEFDNPVRSVLSKLSAEDGRVLLVYDNLDDVSIEHIQRKHEAQWRKMRIIITTRDRKYLHLEGRGHLVGLLSPEDGKPLFLALVGKERTESDKSVTELGQLIGWHPLALEYVASHLKVYGLSLDYYLHRLREPSSMVGLFRDADDTSNEPRGKVYEVFESSLEKIEKLEPFAADWFKMCCFLGVTIEREVFALAYDFWLEEQDRGFGGPGQQLSWLFEGLPRSLEFKPPYDKLLILSRLSLVNDQNGCWELQPLVARWGRDRLKTKTNARKYLTTAVCLIHACAEMVRRTKANSARRDTDDAYYAQLGLLGHAKVCIEYCNREFEGKIANVVPIECVVTLAAWNIHGGDYGKAIGMLQSMNKHQGTSSPGIIDMQRTLAWALRKSRRYADAEECQRAVIKLLREGYERTGVNDSETVRARGELASIFRDKGDLENAICIQLEVVAEAKGIFGLGSPETWHEMSCLATIYRRDKQLEKTLDIVMEIYRLCVSHGGQEQDILRKMKHLAVTYFDLGCHSKAIELNKDVLVKVEGRWGMCHVETATALHRLAQCYYAAEEELKDAYRLVSKALEVRRELLGGDHEKTKKSEALVSKIRGDPEMAGMNSESSEESEEDEFSKPHNWVDSGIAME